MRTKRFEEGGNNENKGTTARDFQLKFASSIEANNLAGRTGSNKRPEWKSKEHSSETFKDARDPVLDSQLKAEIKKKSAEVRYQHMQHYRRSLPAYECSVDIVNVINNNQVRIHCNGGTISL